MHYFTIKKTAASLALCICLLAGFSTGCARNRENTSSGASSGPEITFRDSSSEPESRPESAEDSSQESSAQEESIPQASAPDDTPAGGSEETVDLLVLVNAQHPLPADAIVDTVPFQNGYPVDRRAHDALQELFAAAQADGISLWVLSGYRPIESQTRIFQNKMEEYLSAGLSQEEAYVQTALYIAPPGTSEHATGLAVDLNSLETSFEETPAFAWLMEHCAEYGFILRYPKDKTAITNIAYEPWHYRYVGKAAAQEIMGKGLCLEEYVSN